MLLMLLPLRLGEFARPLLIARPPPGGGAPLRRSGALASIVVERIVDGIFIGILGIISLRLLGDSASGKYLEFARSASVLVAAGFLALCLGLVLAVLFREQALRLSQALLGPLSPRLSERVESGDRKSTRLNSSNRCISYAVFCLKKKTTPQAKLTDR